MFHKQVSWKEGACSYILCHQPSLINDIYFRLSHLPNIENHRFDPDISPYDLPKVEDFKKVPDRYKNAPIYDMKGDRGHSRRNNRRKDVVRDQNIRKSDSIKNFPREEFKIPRIPNSLRQSPGSNNRPSFLSTILSPLNPFKSLVIQKSQITL